MVSFDVVSLFTSIPQQLAIDVVRPLLTEHYDERDKPLRSEHLLKLLRYCLKTFFIFGGQMYEQIKGIPMGFPLSGLIAEVVLQRIEHLVFTKCDQSVTANTGLFCPHVNIVEIDGGTSRIPRVGLTLNLFRVYAPV
ncbi:unnamed protein product, partial [Dibothriocephalus latus]